MKTYTDAITTTKATLKTKLQRGDYAFGQFCFNDVKEIFCSLQTSYKSKKRFIREYAPSYSFKSFQNFRNILKGE